MRGLEVWKLYLCMFEPTVRGKEKWDFCFAFVKISFFPPSRYYVDGVSVRTKLKLKLARVCLWCFVGICTHVRGSAEGSMYEGVGGVRSSVLYFCGSGEEDWTGRIAWLVV